jgi:xylulokinase
MFLAQNEVKTHPRLWAMPYYRRGKYLLGGGTSSTGAIVQWFKDNFASNKSYRELDDEAENAGMSDLVLLPYFMGERTPILDESARGMLFGLRIEHTGANVYRALLEATAYAIRHHIDIMEETGAGIKKIMLVNGGSKSRVWRQIISDVLQRAVYRAENAYGAPFGDAYGAGMGTGRYRDLKQVREFLGREEITEPKRGNKEKYDRLYHIYIRLYEKTREEMRDIGRLNK